MNCPELVEPETKPAETTSIIRLPLGLFGFEGVKEYVLLGRPDEAPFFWLRRSDNPDLSFVVVPPATVVPDYHPEVSPEDVKFLELTDPKDAVVLNIVTLQTDGRATVNLKGPIVLNRRTLVGRQVIPLNAAQFSPKHPLPVVQ